MFGQAGTVVAAAGEVILAHGAMGPWDEVAVGVPVPALFVVLLVIGRRSRRIVFEDDEDLGYSGADSFEDGGGSGEGGGGGAGAGRDGVAGGGPDGAADGGGGGGGGADGADTAGGADSADTADVVHAGEPAVGGDGDRGRSGG